MKKYIILLFLNILYLNAQSPAQTVKIKNASNPLEVLETKNSINSYLIEQNELLKDFKSFGKDYQRFIFDMPIEFIEDNSPINNSINTTPLFQSSGVGFNLNGADVVAGVWDGGRVRDTHIEFESRLLIGDTYQTLSQHATHVSGIIMAKGINASARGIANGVNGLAYYWDQDIAEMTVFAESGYLVSNHSYGYNVGGFENWRFGKYDDTSRIYDQLMRTFPYYQIVTSAGNERNDNTLGQVLAGFGYDLLTGKGCSKNALVVAATNSVPNYVDSSSVVMSQFSNYGPTDDGRIKPDIAAQGVAVFSTNSTANTAYTTLQGTSMSSPCIAGLIALLQQHYFNLKNEYMKSSLVRGLICNTASEAGANPGPDYEFGWGLANGLNAAQCISNSTTSSILEVNSLNNNAIYSKNITITSLQKLKFTICWTDIQGANNNNTLNDRSPRLVNNLDLKVLYNGETFYPWRLDPEFPGDGALNDSDNNVDNIETVEIETAQPGIYIIQVNHKGTLQGGSQEFSLIANGSSGISLNTSDYQYDNSIFVYPNPANTILNFKVKNDITIDTISVTDIAGKQIFKSTNTIDNAIDVSNLSSGVYFITFTSENNSVTKKFIKQ
jgi:hypothetical protein